MNYSVLLITMGFVLTIGLVSYLILSPGKTNKLALSNANNMDPSLKKLMKMFGGDISALIPSNYMKSQVRDKSLERLFRESANPWRITITEFIIVKFILLGIGLLISTAILGALTVSNGIQLGILLFPIFPLYLFNYPVAYYSSVAKDRENKFKAQLPEAIDYLTMALSGGGYSLPIAFEVSTKYIPDGIIKDEFTIIVNDLRAGKTIESSLQDFADRAPTDGIKAFAKALINANKLSVPMIDILRARAYASRKDLETEIEKRVSILPSKITLVFSPTTAISLLLSVATPAIYTIIKLL